MLSLMQTTGLELFLASSKFLCFLVACWSGKKASFFLLVGFLVFA